MPPFLLGGGHLGNCVLALLAVSYQELLWRRHGQLLLCKSKESKELQKLQALDINAPSARQNMGKRQCSLFPLPDTTDID
uniref:Secreted protein n=1 Tax=Steinernema glaseri TaxID=37863 RepID=A0A1I7YKP2_9BILA